MGTLVALIGIAMVSIGCLQAAGREPSSSSPPPLSPQRALLNRYCVTCHNEKLKTAGLMLDKMDVENVSFGAEVWEKVLRKLRTGAMPPAGMPRPDMVANDSFATYLETALDNAAAAKPNPGRPAVHRLNRAEYTNAIRDLLGLEIDGESLLPADDSGYGFDNIGDVLSVSPMLLGRYLSAARQISRLAVGDPTIRPEIKIYAVPRLRLQDDRSSEDLPFGSRGGIAIQHNFPLDGEYLLKIRLLKNRDGLIIGLSEPHQLDVRLDGSRIKLFAFGGNLGATGLQGDVNPEEVEAGLEIRFPAKAGKGVVGVAFLNERSLSEGLFKPLVAALQLYDWGPEKGDPGVESIAISGPYDVSGAGDTPSRRKIFVCRPTDSQVGSEADGTCAEKTLSSLARLAYRRPVTRGDLDGMLRLYRAERNKNGFEAGIGIALRSMLLSPEFLFRIESDPPGIEQASAHRISDLELASRLSFFLWSSIPDEELLSLAERGKLQDSKVLQQQVQRMLRNFRSKALVDNFARQWLDLRSLRSAAPNPDTFIDFDESLREAFQEETELFFESILIEDRSVLDLLDADYTFVNERLARHYGIPNVYGSRFRQVALTDEARMGLLGKGSILTVTSHPNRTSPVLRGKWVLDNILGTPPPPPPPNVPDLQENEEAERSTVRQQMEQHRANPVCASCHSRMDPLGFGLESFDAIGRWRTAETEARIPIDVSGVLPDGTEFQGAAGLRRILSRHPEQFARTVIEKMLTYALGRGVEYYDEPAIRKILREAAPSRYRWSALIMGIVNSVPFQMRMSAEPTTASGLR